MASRVTKETIDRIKQELPSILDENPILSFPAIAKKLNISRMTLWVVRKSNKRVSTMLEKYMATKKEDVPVLVRQTFEGRLISGKAQGSEYMFYLMNKFPDEFQDKRALVNNTNIIKVDNKVEAEQKYLQSLPDKDLDDLVNGIAERRKIQVSPGAV